MGMWALCTGLRVTSATSPLVSGSHQLCAQQVSRSKPLFNLPVGVKASRGSYHNLVCSTAEKEQNMRHAAVKRPSHLVYQSGLML